MLNRSQPIRGSRPIMRWLSSNYYALTKKYAFLLGNITFKLVNNYEYKTLLLHIPVYFLS